MRLRIIICAVLLLLLPLSIATAETITYGDVTYVYPGPSATPTTLTLISEGASFDTQTLAATHDPALPGAVFGIYAKDANGNFVPFHDPSNPLTPLTLTSGSAPVTVALPLSIDLYIKQENAPDGYVVDPDLADYRALSLPETITATSRRAGMQGVWLTLTGDTGTESIPLTGIGFTLEGMGKTHSLITNDTGKASIVGITPGEYTLTQKTTAPGYAMDTPEQKLAIREHEPLQLSIQNSRDGYLTLRTMGLAMDATRTARLVPIDRAYGVYDESGTKLGTLSPGESLPLPSSKDGRPYTLRAKDAAPADGFAADPEEHSILLYPGQTSVCQTAVQSEKGFFTFTHISTADDAPIPGGSFALTDANGAIILSFDADAAGHYDPIAPLAPGQYTLRMTQAAEGFLYAAEPLMVEIEPYFSGQHPITQITFVSSPVPAFMSAPEVASTSQTFASLFDQDAEISFTLSTSFAETVSLPMTEPVYTFEAPDIPGLEVDSEAADGAALSITRRFALPGADEIRELRVVGEVSYSFAYPVDMAGNTEQVHVLQPFEVTVASFAPSREASYAISGYVYDEAGQPMPGINVSLGGETIVTDAFGAYAFTKAPSGEAIEVDTPEGFGVRMDENDAFLLPLRTITGRVELHGGLQGYPVTLAIGDLSGIAPDAGGRFTITGIFGSSEALLASTKEGILSRVTQEGNEAIVALYPAAGISGIVSDPDDAPIPGAKLSLRGSEGSEIATTGEDGAFSFEGLFPGEYTLTADVPAGYVLNSEPSVSISLEAGASQAESFNAMKPGEISGMLLDGSAPYANIPVSLSPTGAETITDADGRFTFDGLSTGDYTLAFELPAEAILLDIPEAISITHSGQLESIAMHAVRPAQISGRIWYDEDDDGLMAVGEGGQQGAEVALYDAAGKIAATQTTGSDGYFTFSGLVPGDYSIGVTLPGSMIFARSAPGSERIAVDVDGQEAQGGPYSVVSGQRLSGLIAGAINSGSVEGILFEDADGNGLLEGSEPRLASHAITLLRNGNILQTAETDSQGRYRFENLRPGEYQVRLALPEDSMFTTQITDEAAGTGSTFPKSDAREAACNVTLRRWRMDAKVNAGYQRAASIAASVFFDSQANGQSKSGTAQEGILIALYHANGGNAPLQEVTTDAGGNAAFGPLRPGQYQLRYRLPESTGWGFTTGTTERSGVWGFSAPITLSGADAYTAEAVGVTKLGTISGIAFEDGNYNGLRDAEEPGLPLTVTLLDASGKAMQETTVLADGSYAFDGLTSGLYAVRFTIPEGYAFTTSRSDAPSFNSDVPETYNLTSQTTPVYLPVGEKLLIDAGAYRIASLSGALWQDVQNDGLWHAENPPLAGYVVTLLRDGKEVATKTTNADGQYSFTRLAPGEYTVRFTLSEGMRFSKPSPSILDRRSLVAETEDVAGQTRPVTLAGGETLGNVDAGAVYTGAVTGKVTDMKEKTGLAGVQVTLRQDGTNIAEATTDASGAYLFDDIRPGVALVRVTTPEGYALSAEQADAVSTEIPQGGLPAVVDVQCIPEAAIEGKLWMDGNADGVLSGGEAPMLGVKVTLYRMEGLSYPEVAQAITDSTGSYRFDKLLPGQYKLGFAAPTGVTFYNGTDTTPFNLAMGETRTHDVTGYIGSTIRGFVWEDTNNDGLHALGEAPLAGVRVTLIRPDGSFVRETSTDATGSYRFDALPPMECAVRFTLPEEFIFANPTEGGSVVPLTDSNVGATSVLSLPMGTTLTDINAGALVHTRVGDLIWLDENANGLQDSSEPGVEGIVIGLLRVEANGSETLVAETTSDRNGRYRFDSVRPGTYRISFAIGNGYVPTKPTPGLDQINSKLEWVNAPEVKTEPFIAPSGKHLLTADAGVVTQAQASQYGWLDQMETENSAAPVAQAGAEKAAKTSVERPDISSLLPATPTPAPTTATATATATAKATTTAAAAATTGAIDASSILMTPRPPKAAATVAQAVTTTAVPTAVATKAPTASPSPSPSPSPTPVAEDDGETYLVFP